MLLGMLGGHRMSGLSLMTLDALRAMAAQVIMGACLAEAWGQAESTVTIAR